MTSNISQADWPRVLQILTDRNAGRRTTIDELGGELGAQEEESGYPLRGVAFDRRARQVEIMLGDSEGTEHHLTRGIMNVRVIDILRDYDGRDRAVRFERPDGVTILRFSDDGDFVRHAYGLKRALLASRST